MSSSREELIKKATESVLDNFSDYYKETAGIKYLLIETAQQQLNEVGLLIKKFKEQKQNFSEQELKKYVSDELRKKIGSKAKQIEEAEKKYSSFEADLAEARKANNEGNITALTHGFLVDYLMPLTQQLMLREIQKYKRPLSEIPNAISISPREARGLRNRPKARADTLEAPTTEAPLPPKKDSPRKPTTLTSDKPASPRTSQEIKAQPILSGHRKSPSTTTSTTELPPVPSRATRPPLSSTTTPISSHTSSESLSRASGKPPARPTTTQQPSSGAQKSAPPVPKRPVSPTQQEWTTSREKMAAQITQNPEIKKQRTSPPTPQNIEDAEKAAREAKAAAEAQKKAEIKRQELEARARESGKK